MLPFCCGEFNFESQWKGSKIQVSNAKWPTTVEGLLKESSTNLKSPGYDCFLLHQNVKSDLFV